jgi:antitoxin VapB
MALSIKHEDVERLARELARRRHVSITEAIRQSLEREMEREKAIPRNEQAGLAARLLAIAASAAQIPERKNALRDEEILGYDEFGVPGR